MTDCATCDACGRVTDIDLLDAKDDGTGDFAVLACERCYGPDWEPATMGTRPLPLLPFACLEDGTVLAVSHVESGMVYGEEIDMVVPVADSDLGLQCLGLYAERDPFCCDACERWFRYSRAPLHAVARWWDMTEFQQVQAMVDADVRLLSYAR